MRATLLAILLAAPVMAQSDEATWLPMTGAQITQALTDRKLQYASASQTFYASGRTLYETGRPSWGYWRVENDQYCSMWPPSDLWACYGMAQSGDRLRFVGAQGDLTEGAFAE